MSVNLYPDFQCPHCGHGVTYSEEPDLLAGMGPSNEFTYECECGATFKVSVDWTPYSFVDESTLKAPEVAKGEGMAA